MFWGLATPSYWACLHHGFECARALGLVWNFSPSQSTWESFFFALHSCSKSPIKLFLTPQVESGAPPVYISPAPCTLAQPHYTTGSVKQGRPFLTIKPPKYRHTQRFIKWMDFFAVGCLHSPWLCPFKQSAENSLVVQRSGLCTSTARGTGLIPGQWTKILPTVRHSQKKKKKARPIVFTVLPVSFAEYYSC